jgi:hypothetical protein
MEEAFGAQETPYMYHETTRYEHIRKPPFLVGGSPLLESEAMEI